MSGLETLLLKLGASVVKSTIKIWLGDAMYRTSARYASLPGLRQLVLLGDGRLISHPSWD